MKTPAQKVIYSLLTLILLLSIGSGVVATNGNRTELINPELDNELSEETLKIIPIEDTLDYALYEQADKYGHSPKRELAFLTAHSMLHLFGYDHMTPEEAAVMEKGQEEILAAIGITRG